VKRPGVGPAEHGPFHAAMLIAQRNLQVMHRLAVALKAEVPRLDYACVYRPDSHFVNLFAVHVEEVGDADGFAARKANWLEPRMPLRLDVALLGQLALEQVGRGAVGRQRGVRIFTSHDSRARSPDSGRARTAISRTAFASATG